MNNFFTQWQKKSFLQKFFILFIICSGAAWVIIPALYCNSLHFDQAETLMWGSTFNWGSAKHPPMSGIMLYNFCKLFGFPNYAIFLLSQICVTLGFVYIYKLARCFFDRDHSVMATLLITFYFFYNYETPKFNANIPHLLFIPMMCYYYFRGIKSNKWHHWILLAVCGAAAFLSKYSVGIVFVSFAIYLIADKNARRCLVSVKPYIAAIICCLLLSLHIRHLIDTDFLVFNYISHGKPAKYGYFMQLLVFLAAAAAPLLSMISACVLIHALGNKRFPSFKNFKIHNPAAFKYSACIIGGQLGCLLLMGICGHRLLTIWTFQLFLTAGILIMSFYPTEATNKVKRTFAVFVTVFGVLMVTFPLVYYSFKSKYRYHLDKTEFRMIAENFYREKTGKSIPCITGDIWHAAMLQNTFKYQIKAFPLTDPILMSLHKEKLASDGALIIAVSPQGYEKYVIAYFGVKPQWFEYKLDYSAKFGKKKTYKFYLAVLPPVNIKSKERK
jgi:4-amino-4-deoxy-L-arabinose transferase-like glycosyltransferase